MSAPEKKTFARHLQDARLAGEQTTDVMAVLLNITQEEYELLESGQYPDDETLRRICTLLGWNYYDTQRLLINEMIAPRDLARAPVKGEARGKSPAPSAPLTVGEPHPLPATPLEHGGQRTARPTQPETLGSRLREVRLVTGQSVDVIAMLLNTDAETYMALEAGASPNDEMLRRVSSVYRWNYQELLNLLRTEHARSFQPVRVGTPYPAATADLEKLKALNQDVQNIFYRMNANERTRVLAQIELIRDTMRRDLAS